MAASTQRTRSTWPDPARCTVEVLVVSGCPGTRLTLERVCAASEATGVETNLRLVIVDGPAHADALDFRGSPTVRVEGADVEKDASSRPVGLACRLYDHGEVVERAPPVAWICAALEQAAAGRRPS